MEGEPIAATDMIAGRHRLYRRAIILANTIRNNFRGVLISTTLAIAAMFLSEHYTAPVMIYALLLGMAFHFIALEPGPARAGIEFSSKTLLRIAVGLLGAQITFSDMMRLGLTPVLIVISSVVLTIGFGVVMARLLKLDRSFGLLTGGAVAICGASAALAISAVLPKSETQDRDVIFTVIGVTTLSTLAMVLYPVLITLFHLDHTAIGIFLGATIHDVAQVVGAGFSVSDETGNVSTFVKLLRVAMLLPVVALMPLIFQKGRAKSQTVIRQAFPGFLVVFAVLVAANSAGLLAVPVIDALKSASRWMLVTAIAALGMKTSLKAMTSLGARAIILIIAETVFLTLFILAIVLFVLPR